MNEDHWLLQRLCEFKSTESYQNKIKAHIFSCQGLSWHYSFILLIFSTSVWDIEDLNAPDWIYKLVLRPFWKQHRTWTHSGSGTRSEVGTALEQEFRTMYRSFVPDYSLFHLQSLRTYSLSLLLSGGQEVSPDRCSSDKPQAEPQAVSFS